MLNYNTGQETRFIFVIKSIFILVVIIIIFFVLGITGNIKIDENPELQRIEYLQQKGM